MIEKILSVFMLDKLVAWSPSFLKKTENNKIICTAKKNVDNFENE
jgi:hypothetical protein